MLAPAILIVHHHSDILYLLTAITYVLMFAFLLKPLFAVTADDTRQYVGMYRLMAASLSASS